MSIPLMIASNFGSNAEGFSLKVVLLSTLALFHLAIRFASTLTAIFYMSAKV